MSLPQIRSYWIASNEYDNDISGTAIFELEDNKVEFKLNSFEEYLKLYDMINLSHLNLKTNTINRISCAVETYLKAM